MTRLFFWEEGYGEEPEWDEEPEPDPARSGRHIAVVPDDGCRQYEKCLTCPLAECVYDYLPDQTGVSQANATGWRQAVTEATTRSFEKYAQEGDAEAIERMLTKLRSGALCNPSPEMVAFVRKHEGIDGAPPTRRAALAHAMAKKGYTLKLIASVFGAQQQAVHNWIRRSKIAYAA